MNQNSSMKSAHPGYVSITMVLSTGVLLTLFMIFAYKRAIHSQSTQSKVQLHLDYAEKEETILRAVVAITPNRAIRAMQGNSNTSTNRAPLQFSAIFTEALALANAGKSISDALLVSMNASDSVIGNVGDSTLTNTIFSAVANEQGYVSPGINRSLGAGYPVPLTSTDSTTSSRDASYPLISNKKIYGQLADGLVGASTVNFPDFNLIPYPQIDFGYAEPGEPFVAKRNWWAFSMDLAGHDSAKTQLARKRRDFVLSIYEIPSQLAISASSFMALGTFGSEAGEAWKNVTIEGGVFAGRAQVEGETSLPALASRRGMTISHDATIGGESFDSDPFSSALRDQYKLTPNSYFPVSLASESGRAAFIPINRGADFFDRFAHSNETNTVSTTTWNQYSVGANQAAMRLDIVRPVSAEDRTPAELRFSYRAGGALETMTVPPPSNNDVPAGYIQVAVENGSYFFRQPVDIAYGARGTFAYQSGISGWVRFDNARFGDPLYGVRKFGSYRPSYPFEVGALPNGQICLKVYPKRFPKFLDMIGADSTASNHSLVVNVDYTSSALLQAPNFPCTNLDYGLILEECDDLTAFTKGFSLVTNLRLYIGDDFNTQPLSPGGTSYPPCSIFAPEKRYGTEMDPYFVEVSGQVGSLGSESANQPIRPLDSTGVSGRDFSADQITVNLRPIKHPSELPPISMMNWLIVLEEKRGEFTN